MIIIVFYLTSRQLIMRVCHVSFRRRVMWPDCLRGGFVVCVVAFYRLTEMSMILGRFAGRHSNSPLNNEKRGRSINFNLVCLVAACVIPVWLIAGILIHHSYRAMRAQVTENMLEVARFLSMNVDRELASIQAALTGLATSPCFAAGDLAGIHRQTRELLRHYPDADIILADAGGQQLVNSYLPFGAALPKRSIPETVRRVFDTGKPVVSDVFFGALTGRSMISVDIPVFRDGRVVYDLSMTLPTSRLTAILSQYRLPAGRFGAILDSRGALAARTRFQERFVGKKPASELLDTIAASREGVVSMVNFEGIRVFSAFSRSEISNWAVVIGVPSAHVLSNVYRWLGWAITGTLLLSLTGIGLALRIGRTISGPIQTVRTMAALLGHNQPLAGVERTGLKEADEVALALIQSSELSRIRLEERNSAEALLQRSERRYRTVVGDQTETICRYHPDGSICFVNEVYCKLFGRNAEDMVGKRWYPVVLREDLPAVEAQLRALTSAHPVVTVENRVFTVSGEIRWMQFVNRGTFDDQGRLVEVQSVGRDITQRKQVENELRESRKLLQAIFDGTEEAIFVKDLSGRCILANQALLRLLGKGEGEVVGKTTCQVHPDPETVAAIVARENDVMTLGKEVTAEEYIITALGRRLLCTTKLPRRAADGRIIGLIGITRDITERKRAEQDLRDYARRLVDTEEMLRKAIAGELHDEIGRDLTVLGITLSIIDSQFPREADHALRARVGDSARLVESVSRTVRDIMANLRPPVLDDYGLLAALRWHGDLFSKRTGIAVSVLANEPVPRLPVDRELALFRIAQEALTNVAKHAAAREVIISLRHEGGYVALSVVDDGKGIHDVNISQGRRHSGWGMTIMRERAELAGGALRVESEPGQGVAVVVEISNGEDA